METPKNLGYFLDRLRDLDWLAGADLEGKCVMDSSLNQRMGPRDCNFFWSTSGPATGTRGWLTRPEERISFT